MPTLYDHISSNSKTAFRKVLCSTLKEQFAQATLFVARCVRICVARGYILCCVGESMVTYKGGYVR